MINADGTPGTRTIVAPKGIYKTPHGYRVQLNIEHKSKKQTKKPRAGTAAATAAAAEKDRQTTASEFDPLGALRSKISASLTSEMASSSTNTGKFSRNSKSFEDAVWLYEVAILLSDDIRSTSELIGRGNYESMEAMRWIDNEQAYLDSFAANILKLGNSKLLTPIEHAIATATFERITNHHKDSVSPRGSPRGSPRSTAGARGASTGTHLDIKLSSGGVPLANAGGTSISPGGSALSVPTAAVM